MKILYNWKKIFFSDTYKIYSHSKHAGELKNKAFTNTSYGEFNGLQFMFKTTGFFKQKTRIYDKYKNVIGEINYNNLMTKAALSLNNKRFNWKYDNLLNTKWRIFNAEGIEIKYSGSSLNGIIESNTDDALLLLSGIFVTNYYWQITVAVLIAVFVPLFSTLH
jgi:hypothetical protein